MATASVTNTFSNTTLAQSAQVNTNFTTDLVAFINNQLIHRDGSKTFTAAQPMGSNKLTGLGAGSGAGDSVRFEQPLLAAIVDAKGDLIVASANDTPARLAVGTNAFVLVADSAESVGAKWAAYVHRGKVHLVDFLTADQVWTGSGGSYTTINNLDLVVAANEKWYVEFNYSVVSPSAPGGAAFRVKSSTIPSGTTGWGATLGGNQINFIGGSTRDLAQQFTLGGQSTGTNYGTHAFYFEVGGTGGTLQWEMANVGNGDSFTLHKGANITAYKLTA